MLFHMDNMIDTFFTVPLIFIGEIIHNRVIQINLRRYIDMADKLVCKGLQQRIFIEEEQEFYKEKG